MASSLASHSCTAAQRAAGKNNNYSMTATKKIPTLRFKEFEGEWEEKTGNEITDKITKGSSPKWQGFNYVDSGVLFVTSENIREGYIDISSPKYLTKEFNLKQKNSELRKGDVLINIVGASIGRSAIFNLDLVANINQAVAIFRVKPTYSKEYVSYYIQLDSTQKGMVGVQSESARPNLSLKNLNELVFYLPSLPEQQKIASFLTSVDDKIQQLTKKKALLEAYKKGLMQDLFSKQLRFKDDEGNDYPNWEEKELHEIGEFKNGLNKSKEDFGFGYPFINLMDVFGKTSIIGNTFDLVNASETEIKSYNLKKGDVLFIRSSVKREGVGEASVILEDMDKTVYSGFLIRFREKSDNEKLDVNFKKYCFNNVRFRNELLSLSTTSANTNINQEALSVLKIQIPVKEEQQKIANILTSIDNKINLVAKRLEKATAFKKGLLQQLFI